MGRYSYRRKGHETASARIIRGLIVLQPEVRKDGFAQAMRDLFPGNEDVAQAVTGLIPDAFAVYPEASEINMIEVVDTSPIHRKKAERIASLAESLADVDWTLGVVCFDGAGNLTSHLPGVLYSPLYAQFDGDANNATPRALAAARNGIGSQDALKAAMLSLPPVSTAEER